jgi:hypothetical protein
MTEIDRANVLQDLDLRHDELLAELEALNGEVEAALGALRPPSAPPVQMAALVDRTEQPQTKRRAQRYAQ